MLQPLDTVDPQEAGGKGAALARLLRHGFPVPPTWVLPYGAFAAFWAHNHLEPLLRAEDWARLDRAILGGTIPFSLVAPGPLLAVRSSAGDEDGKEGSAAGQYHSILSVQPSDLADAVRRCWASYYGPEARSYRKKAPEKPQMALLLQEMVDARSAGVLFTINPLNGSWREMPIEAVWGLGESLVSGRMVPDRYLLRRPRRTPPALIAGHMELRLEEETIAPQPMQLLARSGRVEQQEAEAPKARKLGQVDLVKLGRLGLRAEALFGEPQDVEWAQDRAGEFWVLQSRPITTHARLPRGGSTLWTRRFLGERWPQGASPLGWSLMEPILEWFIAYPQTSAQFLGGDPPLRLVRGHPYLNATVFRHLAFKLPGRPPPQFMLEFFPPDEADHWLRRWGAPPDFRVYASILKSTFEERRWERFRWNPFRNHRAWNSFRDQLGARLAELSACPPEDAVRVGSALVRDYIKVHITSLLFANLYYQLVAPLLSPEDQELLLRPPAGSITSKVNRELWRLSKDPELLPSFLREHGHRSVASWEIFSPRWVEDPEAVLQLSLLWRDRPDPALTLQEEDHKTQLALDRINQPLLKQAVVLAQAYLGLREEQRYHFDRILLLLKQKLCALGAGLPEPSDIRFLTVAELDLPRAQWTAIIEQRRAEVPDPQPPTFLYGDQAIVAGTSGSMRLQGLGISPGVVQGRTRVLHSVEELSLLQPGEILVAAATDPAWTPAFPRAGGLILELGSLLSHGAVVAREYHLPGVVNVAKATEILSTGTEVVLDGRSGAVWIVRRAESS